MSAAATLDAAPAEEAARGMWYALISRFFYAPADAELLKALRPQDEVSSGGVRETPFSAAWEALRGACARSDPEALRSEFDQLFIGVGKAAATPYTAAYAAPHAPDQHLVELRKHLQEWGLRRRAEVFESEDHVSGLCDTMRWLIDQQRTLAEQRVLFSGFVEPGVRGLCKAVSASPLANFYSDVARFTLAFIDVESEGFEMHTPV